jgi:hypothetical protein
LKEKSSSSSVEPVAKPKQKKPKRVIEEEQESETSVEIRVKKVKKPKRIIEEVEESEEEAPPPKIVKKQKQNVES